jgi:hypothetical protein
MNGLRRLFAGLWRALNRPRPPTMLLGTLVPTARPQSR